VRMSIVFVVAMRTTIAEGSALCILNNEYS
jgi:hypothetical protein